MSEDEPEPEKVYSYEPESEDQKYELKASQKDLIRSASSRRQVLTNFTNDKKKFETPLEKLQRLKHEVELFEHDLSIVTTDKPIKEQSSKITVNIGSIETDFNSVLNDSRIAPYISNDIPFNKSAITKEESEVAGALIDQLVDFGGGSKGVGYGLYAQETTSKDKIKLIELDRQIGALEKKVGTIDDVEKVGFSEINEALSILYRKLELLDGHKLESIQRRMTTLTTEFELLEGNMPKLRGTKSSEKQFNELYSHMKKWNKCTLQLPHFVHRLESQVNVHKQHSETLLRLQKLRRQQLALNNIMMQDREALKNVNASLGQNMAIMNKNINNFKKRFTELEKKIKKC